MQKSLAPPSQFFRGKAQQREAAIQSLVDAIHSARTSSTCTAESSAQLFEGMIGIAMESFAKAFGVLRQESHMPPSAVLGSVEEEQALNVRLIAELFWLIPRGSIEANAVTSGPSVALFISELLKAATGEAVGSSGRREQNETSSAPTTAAKGASNWRFHADCFAAARLIVTRCSAPHVRALLPGVASSVCRALHVVDVTKVPVEVPAAAVNLLCEALCCALSPSNSNAKRASDLASSSSTSDVVVGTEYLETVRQKLLPLLTAVLGVPSLTGHFHVSDYAAQVVADGEAAQQSPSSTVLRSIHTALAVEEPRFSHSSQSLRGAIVGLCVVGLEKLHHPLGEAICTLLLDALLVASPLCTTLQKEVIFAAPLPLSPPRLRELVSLVTSRLTRSMASLQESQQSVALIPRYLALLENDSAAAGPARGLRPAFSMDTVQQTQCLRLFVREFNRIASTDASLIERWAEGRADSATSEMAALECFATAVAARFESTQFIVEHVSSVASDWDAYLAHHAVVYFLTLVCATIDCCCAQGDSAAAADRFVLGGSWDALWTIITFDHLWRYDTDADLCTPQQLRHRRDQICVGLRALSQCAALAVIPPNKKTGRLRRSTQRFVMATLCPCLQKCASSVASIRSAALSTLGTFCRAINAEPTDFLLSFSDYVLDEVMRSLSEFTHDDVSLGDQQSAAQVLKVYLSQAASFAKSTKPIADDILVFVDAAARRLVDLVVGERGVSINPARLAGPLDALREVLQFSVAARESIDLWTTSEVQRHDAERRAKAAARRKAEQKEDDSTKKEGEGASCDAEAELEPEDSPFQPQHPLRLLAALILTNLKGMHQVQSANVCISILDIVRACFDLLCSREPDSLTQIEGKLGWVVQRVHLPLVHQHYTAILGLLFPATGSSCYSEEELLKVCDEALAAVAQHRLRLHLPTMALTAATARIIRSLEDLAVASPSFLLHRMRSNALRVALLWYCRAHVDTVLTQRERGVSDAVVSFAIQLCALTEAVEGHNKEGCEASQASILSLCRCVMCPADLSRISASQNEK